MTTTPSWARFVCVKALYKSRNLVSIRLLQTIGIDYALNYATRFGFKRDELPRNLSLALGTATLTPLEIATGWSVLANGGYSVSPYLIEQITDRTGNVVFRANPASAPSADKASTANESEAATVGDAATETKPAERVVDERTTYIMTSMLQDVIRRGTGRRALAMGRNDLAGKTGTTNESKDSWFSGYNADYVTTVWAGFDQPESLGRTEYGGTVALPIWMSFMSVALKDKPEHLQPEPAGILSLRIDPRSGRAAAPGASDAYFEVFKNEDTPPPTSEVEGFGNIPGSPLPEDESGSAPMDLF